MSNAYFKFKQFTVQQQQSAMKVTTEACLFGAWLADKNISCRQILDIGSGTGLLSLMLAQKTNAVIHAIEKDLPTSVEQQFNFEQSPWVNRLHTICQDVHLYQPNSLFDLIVSNPPFYEKDLKSPDHHRNRAMHDTDLTLDSLLPLSQALLSAQGQMAILLPFTRSAAFESRAISKGFQLAARMNVRQTPKHAPFRAMLLFSLKQVGAPIVAEMMIKENNQYSQDFRTLLQDYYLYL